MIEEILRYRYGFLTEENLIAALDTGDVALMKLFMKLPPRKFTASVAKTIIGKGLLETWNLESVRKIRKDFTKQALLHHAVKCQRPKFVESVLE